MADRRKTGPVPDLKRWNDEMYGEHPTPYKGLAGCISVARVRAVFSLAAITPGEDVLEVGCEGGNLLVRTPPSTMCVGTDISSSALSDAAKLFEECGKRGGFVQADAQMELPFRPESFDAIICSEMLEHVPDPIGVLRNIKKVAGTRSRIVVSVPIERPKVALKKALHRVGLLQRLSPGLEAAQSEWHLHVFSRKLLHSIAAEAGLGMDRTRNVWGFHWVAAFTVHS